MNIRTLSIFSAIIISLLFFSFIPHNRNHVGPGIIKKASKKVHTDNPYYIIISKKDYELKVYDDEGWYATYPCVFGSSDLRDKFMEGDKRTPEGKFKVLLKKIHPKWGFELLLD